MTSIASWVGVLNHYLRLKFEGNIYHAVELEDPQGKPGVVLAGTPVGV